MRGMVFLLVLMIACKERYPDPVLIYRNNRTYDSTGKLIHGEVIYFHDNGRVSDRSCYRDGIAAGRWVTYGFADDEVQQGTFSESHFWEDFSDIDYELRNDWQEGDVRFVSIYVYLKRRPAVIDSMQANAVLKRLGAVNKEILFLYNTDTVAHFRKW